MPYAMNHEGYTRSSESPVTFLEIGSTSQSILGHTDCFGIEYRIRMIRHGKQQMLLICIKGLRSTPHTFSATNFSAKRGAWPLCALLFTQPTCLGCTGLILWFIGGQAIDIAQ